MAIRHSHIILDACCIFNNYASELGDDGESATGAIAIQRNWAIATDDKKAISFFKKEAPRLQILSTLEIIKNWADKAAIAESDLASALADIRNKGRYVPAINHPLFDWWKGIIK